MDDPVDCSSSGHRVLEDLVPLRENQVAGDHHAPTLVPLRQEGEEHLDFLPALLHVSDVVDDDDVEMVEPFQRALEFEAPLGDQQSLHDAEGGLEQHLVATLDQRVPDCGAKPVWLDAGARCGAQQEFAGASLTGQLYPRRQLALFALLLIVPSLAVKLSFPLLLPEDARHFLAYGIPVAASPIAAAVLLEITGALVLTLLIAAVAAFVTVMHRPISAPSPRWKPRAPRS